MSPSTRKHISLEKLQWMICFSGFLDLFGVAMLYPLLIHHAKDLGASPSQIGLFGSIYGTLQFFTSPIMGQLSDHYGRRTILLISLIGTGCGYFLLGIADSIFMLALARIPSGVFKHSQSVSRLLISDFIPKEQRAGVFGLFNSVSSLGFIIGPTVGGLMASSHNGFIRITTFSSSLFLLNAVFIYIILPNPERYSDSQAQKSNVDGLNYQDLSPITKTIKFSRMNLFKDAVKIPWHSVGDIFFVRFTFSLAIIIFHSTFTSLLMSRFNTNPTTNGYIISFNGIVSASAGFAIRWISPHFRSNSSLHNTFSIVLVISLALLTFARSLTITVIALVPLCCCTSVLRVTSIVHMHNKGGEQLKGLLSGFRDTVTSIARAVGPLIGGFAYETSLFGPGLFCVILTSLGTVVGFRIKSPKPHTE